MKVTIRPNLNSQNETTIHEGRLGLKIGSERIVTLSVTGTVIRGYGVRFIKEHGQKSVFAGLVGEIQETVMPTSESKRVRYNPHVGDEGFHIDGVPFKGGLVTAIDQRYYLVG